MCRFHSRYVKRVIYCPKIYNETRGLVNKAVMWKRMIREGVIAIVLPLLILMALVAMDAMAVHYYCIWSLMLLEFTGVISGFVLHNK